MTNEETLDEGAKKFLQKRISDNTNRLPVAWLMSFPNSGTSYTSHLVRKVTGRRTASNYRSENRGKDGESNSVFEYSPGGPFWSDANSPEYEDASSGYLLTKTHCGGYCTQCPPEKYIENSQTFSQGCHAGDIIGKDGASRKNAFDSYDKDLVKKAVHMIRDPFDNIVSRFHLYHKTTLSAMFKYPRSKEGFRAYCKDMGERFYNKEKAAEAYYHDDVFETVKDIPCHADFFRYIQWHNLAFTTTRDLGLPTMIIHYENYTDNFYQTKHNLLQFLGQDDINDPPMFEIGKTYREYFTEEEIQAVSTMFSKLALDTTLEHTTHYTWCQNRTMNTARGSL